MKQITLHRDADTEITEAARYYELREPKRSILNEYASWHSLTRNGDPSIGGSG